MPDITAAPADLRLTRRDKVLTLRMRPLTDRDITELEDWLKGYVIRIAQVSINHTTPLAVAELTIRVALSKSLDMTFTSYDGQVALGSLSGMARVIWQCTRVDHPEVKEQDIAHYLLDAESVGAFNTVFTSLNEMPEGDGGTPAKE